MGQADLSVGSDQIYTMRELNHDTAGVMKRINESGRPAIITRHGRFVAMVTPLLGKNVEGAALSAFLRGSSELPFDQMTGEATAEGLSPAEEFDPSDHR